jgi:t-SNARE complex subunit (syntaxin)
VLNFGSDVFSYQGIKDLKKEAYKNFDRLNNRSENLDSLQDKTENLAGTSQTFNRGSHRVRKQMWWKDVKMRIWIIVGIIILLIVIIVPSGIHVPWKHSESEPNKRL